jgi:hypothetical protein
MMETIDWNRIHGRLQEYADSISLKGAHRLSETKIGVEGVLSGTIIKSDPISFPIGVAETLYNVLE